MRATSGVSILVAGLMACGGSVTSERTDEGTGTGGSTTSATSGVTVGSGGSIPNATTYELTIGPFETAPGQENTQCVILEMGNAAPGMLRAVRTELTEGSHHLIVTKVDEGGPSPTPSPCGAFAHAGDSLFIAEKPSMKLAYPQGTGLPVMANQLIGLEMHYINASGTGPMSISGTVFLDVTEGDEDLDEVELLFAGNVSLSIPPHSQASFTSSHEVPFGAQIFGLTSHTHRLGIRATIRRGGPNGEILHDSTTWAEPPFDVFDPALDVGAQPLHLTCDYDNPTDDHVSFGVGFYDEMCFLWAHYVKP